MPFGNSHLQPKGRKRAAEANLASAARHATDGNPRAQGRVPRRSRTCACCAHVLELAGSRGVEGFAEPHVSGPILRRRISERHWV